MIFIALSVFCSITVAVLLKLAKRYQINIPQVILWNYLFAILLCYFSYKPDFIPAQNTSAPWFIYLSLGILLPAIFWFLAASVRNIGIVKTDIAQRLSLFMPILASYFIFREQFNNYKIIGLSVGFLAIFFTLFKKEDKKSANNRWLYPVLVFAGFGIIDILFKQIALNKHFSYTTSLFIVFIAAFTVSALAIVYLRATKKTKIELVNFICGCILGLFNFGNILFYLKAHQALSANPSTVFAAMNLGVIICGSLVGIIIFKEKISKINYAGIFLAIASIILITLSQIYAV